MGPDLREQVSDRLGKDLDVVGELDGMDVEAVLEAVEDYFKDSLDQLAAAVEMIRRQQQAGETAAHYVAALRRMARQTVFGEAPGRWAEAFVQAVFVAGLANEDHRQKIMEMKKDGATPDMKKCLEKVRQLEVSAANREKLRNKPAHSAGRGLGRRRGG